MKTRGEAYWQVLELYWEKISIYETPTVFLRGYEKTPEVARDLFATHYCASEVTNGGFWQLFYNSTGILAPEASAGFARMSLPGLASVVAEAMTLLPAPYPRERVRRRTLAERLDPQAFASLNRRFYELLATEGGGWVRTANAYASPLN